MPRCVLTLRLWLCRHPQRVLVGFGFGGLPFIGPWRQAVRLYPVVPSVDAKPRIVNGFRETALQAGQEFPQAGDERAALIVEPDFLALLALGGFELVYVFGAAFQEQEKVLATEQHGVADEPAHASFDVADFLAH